jgi:hypothetical protein
MDRPGAGADERLPPSASLIRCPDDAALEAAGVEPVKIVNTAPKSGQAIPQAVGVYTNLLVLPMLVLVPTYGIMADDEARGQVAAAFPERESMHDRLLRRCTQWRLCSLRYR